MNAMKSYHFSNHLKSLSFLLSQLMGGLGLLKLSSNIRMIEVVGRHSCRAVSWDVLAIVVVKINYRLHIWKLRLGCLVTSTTWY